MPSVQERAAKMLASRELHPHPWRTGVVQVQGSRPGRLYDVDLGRQECSCENFAFGEGGIKRQAYTHLSTPIEEVVQVPERTRWCKHLELLREVLPIAQVLKDAGCLS